MIEAIRAVARPGLWSSGVNLARGGAVTLDSSSDQETVLRVRVPGRTVPWTVVLYPKDEAWECDCPGRIDPCEHVVAAALSLQQTASTPLATAEQRYARVVHRFSREEGGLSLRRTLVHPDGSETPLEPGQGLTALLADPARAAGLQLEQHDLLVERLLERPMRGPLSPERLDALMTALEPARSVLLDGQPVAVSSEAVVPRVTVEDAGEDVKVTVVADPRISEVVSAGVALCGETLVRLGERAISGAWLENLPSERRYSPGQRGELTGQVLPELAKRFVIDNRSRRLPAIDRGLKPRIQLQLDLIEGGLSVLPTLVYGSPPHVRIDAGRMVYLQGAVPVRDEAAEQRAVEVLRSRLDLVPGRRLTAQGEETARLADRLQRWEGGVVGEGARALTHRAPLRPVLITGDEAGDFTLRFEAQGASADPAAVLRAWREGWGLAPLEGGGWAPLPAGFLDAHGELIADLLAARGEGGRIARHTLPQLAELCDALEQPRPPGLEQLRPLLEGFQGLPEAPLPSDLQHPLRSYQRHGVSWLCFLREAGLGAVLADDMGLGKTVQTLCALSGRSLVVCPTSVLPNWEAEARRFRPSLRVARYHGPGRTLDPSADLTLTTYALLRLDAAALATQAWDTVVLDEAQAIKNPDSQVARAAFGLRARFRIALSGTPLENRLEELWSVIHFTNPGLLGGRGAFDARWASRLEALRRRLRPFLLRRLKSEVAPELPPRTESVLHVTLDDRERAIYDAVHAASRAEVVALLESQGNVLKALEALLRLRQAACHPALVPGQHARGSSKVKALMEALTVARDEGHKALVFSQWTSFLDLIEPELRAAQIDFSRLDGSTVDRAGVTSRFQSADGPPVLLLSLKAGGSGLNLTAADHVFLLDPWWNPAVEAQAADRAHRIGQDRPVMIYRLVSQGTVEEQILALQDRKRALFEAAVGGGTPAAALTREDLLQLLG